MTDIRISITIRGFQSDASDLISKYGLSYKHYGNAGESTRGNSGAKLLKSYVFNAIDFQIDKVIDAAFHAIVHSWGGQENIRNMVSEHKAAEIYVEIVLKSESDWRAIVLSPLIVRDLGDINSKLILSEK